MRSGVLILVGLAAVAGMAWLFLGDSSPTALDDLDMQDVGLDDADSDSGIQGNEKGPASDGTKTIKGRGPEGTGGHTIQAPASKAEGVSGRVLSTDGSPIQGARVDVFEHAPSTTRNVGRPDGEVLATARTAEDGTFVVGPAPEDTPLRVRAEATGYAPAIADVAVRGGYAEILLDRGGSLRVRVVDQSGEPVSDAQAIHIADEVVTQAKADAEGVAVFPALSAGAAALVITAKGYRSLRDAQVTITTDEETERTMVLASAGVVEGTVVDGETDKPITDAQVELHYPSLPTLAHEPSVPTDAAGRFRTNNHAGERERMQFRVRRAGYAEARLLRSASDSSTVKIKLHRTLDAFRGVVYDPIRIPAPGVRVTYGRLAGLMPGEKPPETRTNESGLFKLPAPPWGNRGTGYQIVALSDAGEIGQRYVAVPAKAETETKRVEIHLVGSGQLNGRVYGSDGTPVAGATVDVEPDWSQGSKRAGRGWQVFQTARDRRLLKLETVTDEGGNFLFSQVPAMTFQVNASYGDETGTSRETVVITSGEMAQMDITLGSGGSIEGFVYDDRNEPVAGAQVRAIPVTRQPGVGRTRTLTTRSRSDGTFELRGIAQGQYQLSASLLGYGSAVAKDITAGETGVELVLPQRGRLLGVVLQGGGPFRGTFSAEARHSAQQGASGMIGDGRAIGGGSKRTFNTENGEFEITGLAGGTYTLHVSTPDGQVGASGPIEVAEGRDSARARVELASGASLRGSVQERGGGPIEGAWVQVWPSRNAKDNHTATTGRGRADKAGRYEIKGLGAGSYNVTVWAKGRNWSVDVEVGQGETRKLNLVYERPGRIDITIVDEDDRPIADATPELANASGVRVHANYQASKRDGLIQDPQDWSRMQRSDGDGRVTRHHVPPGRYKVTARHRDYVGSSQEVWVDVQSGGHADARVMLRPKKEGD